MISAYWPKQILQENSHAMNRIQFQPDLSLPAFFRWMRRWAMQGRTGNVTLSARLPLSGCSHADGYCSREEHKTYMTFQCKCCRCRHPDRSTCSKHHLALSLCSWHLSGQSIQDRLSGLELKRQLGWATRGWLIQQKLMLRCRTDAQYTLSVMFRWMMLTRLWIGCARLGGLREQGAFWRYLAQCEVAPIY